MAIAKFAHLLEDVVLEAASDEAVTDGQVTRIVVSLINDFGLLGSGAVTMTDAIVPIVPSVLSLSLIGFTSSVPGNFSYAGAIAVTTLGTILGTQVLYTLARAFGRDRTRAVLLRIPLVNVRDIDTSERWFARNASAAVFFGHLLPGVRSFISIPAGVEGMNRLRFGLCTAAGCLLWNSTWITVGHRLGREWHRVAPYAGVFFAVVAIGFALAVTWFVVTRLRRRRLARRADRGSDVA